MKRVTIALVAGVPVALLFLGSAGAAFAQDDDIDDLFDRARGVFDEDDRDRSGLPFGATLLHSADAECEGTLVASGIGRDGEDVHGIRRGDDEVFRVAEQSVPWACLGARTARADVMECPNGTTDVRIALEGNVARFECYGEDR